MDNGLDFCLEEAWRIEAPTSMGNTMQVRQSQA
jgi:hypothetical protein